ncbi:MAG: ribonuclease J [Mariprofundaceae bacterium]
MPSTTLRLFPFGGVGEFGKNMMVYAWGQDAIMVDCGIGFPEPGQHGVDVLIPDISALQDLGLKLHAVILTHGHEDHIGALPYLFPELNCPLYGTGMTLALIKVKLADAGIDGAELITLREDQSVQIGPFELEAIPVTHSIMDAVSLAIHTPHGTIIHTGDFKIDPSPLDGRITDLNRFASLGDAGVVLLVSDSTNATRQGSGFSERSVGPGLKQAIMGCQGKVVVTTFSSNMFRIQQLIDVAKACGRRVALAGRSLERNVDVARSLNRLQIAPGQLVPIKSALSLPSSQILIIATGSQGESRAALGRIARGQFPNLELKEGDLVVFSSSSIPGNEYAISALFNHIYRRGARILHAGQAFLHVSGHAHEYELKTMIQLTRPRYFYPVHGEYRYLIEHQRLAMSMHIPEKNILIAENGQSVELSSDGAVPGDKFSVSTIYVDGGSLGEVDNLILRDRRALAQEGIVTAIVKISRQEGRIIGSPELVARGFIHPDAGEDMLQQAADELKDKLERWDQEMLADADAAKEEIRILLRRSFKRIVGRRPMVVPIGLEI